MMLAFTTRWRKSHNETTGRYCALRYKLARSRSTSQKRSSSRWNSPRSILPCFRQRRLSRVEVPVLAYFGRQWLRRLWVAQLDKTPTGHDIDLVAVEAGCSPVVHLEHLTCSLFLEQPPDIDAYEQTLKRRDDNAVAVDEAGSLELIARATRNQSRSFLRSTSGPSNSTIDGTSATVARRTANVADPTTTVSNVVTASCPPS